MKTYLRAKFIAIVNRIIELFKYNIMILLLRLAVFYMSAAFKQEFLKADFKRLDYTFSKVKNISVDVKTYIIGISDPMWVTWGRTSDSNLYPFFYINGFGLSKTKLRDYGLFLLLFFCGVMKRTGQLEEVKNFCQQLSERPDPKLKSLALWQVADICHLYLRWKMQLNESFEQGTFFSMDQYFPSGSNHETLFNGMTGDTVLDNYLAAAKAADFSWLYYDIGRLYEAMRDFEKSLSFYRKAAENCASPIPLIYAARMQFFIDGDEEGYQLTLKNSPLISKPQATMPMRVELTSFEDAAPQFENIKKIWDGVDIAVSYKVAHFNQVKTIAKTLHFKPMHFGFFNHVQCLARPFALINEKYLFVDTSHFLPQCHKMFCPSLLNYFDKFASLLFKNKRASDQTVIIDEPVLILGGSTHPDYYHFLFEALGSAALLQGTDHENRKIVFSNPPARYQLELLSLLELKNEILIEKQYRRFSSIIYTDALLLQCTSNLTMPHPKSIEFLRSKLYVDKGGAKKGRRLHLTRPTARSLNSDSKNEFLDILVKNNFEIVEPGKMTIENQRQFFADVEVLSVEAGAACGNLIFCPPETRVIIIAPTSHVFEIWSTIASHLGQKLWMCLEDTADDYPAPYFLWNSLNLDINIDTFKICLGEALLSIELNEESKTAH